MRKDDDNIEKEEGEEEDSFALVITGASRGFGRALAVVAAELFDPNKKEHYDKPLPSEFSSLGLLILVARSLPGLQETERLVQGKMLSSPPPSSSKKISISCHAMDLGDLSLLDSHLDKIFDAGLQRYKRLVFIQNAGTIGHLGPCKDSPSLQDMQANIELNITSCLWTCVRVVQFAKTSRNLSDLIIVNISSLTSIEDFPTFGVYSAGKAARDRYHSVLAKEAENDNAGANIRTLNYAPGPLETDMVTEIRMAESLDATLKSSFQTPLLNPCDSARKLMRLLKSQTFKSGAHVDYYDLPDGDLNVDTNTT